MWNLRRIEFLALYLMLLLSFILIVSGFNWKGKNNCEWYILDLY
jgi:hypothetical protein